MNDSLNSFPISPLMNGFIIGTFAFIGLVVGWCLQGLFVGAGIGLLITLIANGIRWVIEHDEI